MKSWEMGGGVDWGEISFFSPKQMSSLNVKGCRLQASFFAKLFPLFSSDLVFCPYQRFNSKQHFEYTGNSMIIENIIFISGWGQMPLIYRQQAC